MTYITLINGIQLVSESDKDEVLELIIQSEREGKPWMKMDDGCGYYRTSSVVSVFDKELPLAAGEPINTSFLDIIMGHRKED